MVKPNAVNHIAVATADMKKQIEFFCDVLGMELVALYWMHGVEGAWHGFLKLNDTSAVAFAQTPEIRNIPSTLGVTHSGNGGGPCAAGTMQHLALNVNNEAELLTMRDRIRSHGIEVFGPIDHGMGKSIYFAGLENISLEITTFTNGIDPRAWIDPEVVSLAGISEKELGRYRNPPSYAGKGGAVPQPPEDPTKPRMTLPPKQYRLWRSLSDEEFGRMMSETEPPVKVDVA